MWPYAPPPPVHSSPMLRAHPYYSYHPGNRNSHAYMYYLRDCGRWICKSQLGPTVVVVSCARHCYRIYIHCTCMCVRGNKVYYVLTSNIMIIVQRVYPWSDGGEVLCRERRLRCWCRIKSVRERHSEKYTRTQRQDQDLPAIVCIYIYIYNIYALCILYRYTSSYIVCLYYIHYICIRRV